MAALNGGNGGGGCELGFRSAAEKGRDRVAGREGKPGRGERRSRGAPYPLAGLRGLEQVEGERRARATRSLQSERKETTRRFCSEAPGILFHFCSGPFTIEFSVLFQMLQ